MNPKNTRILRAIFAVGAAVGLSACASVDSVDYNQIYENRVYETTSRAVPVVSDINPSAESATIPAATNFKVTAVNVTVPRTLRVSEANRYLPKGDIVWREDPIGNRHLQVQAIVQNALSQGVTAFDGGRELVLDVVVTRFHALTEKARYSVGGVHAIQFEMRMRDAQTGQIVFPAKFIKADFDALGGRAAVRAEAQGITQKVRITNHLIHVIREELGSPDGYIVQNNGFIGAINQI